MSILTLNEIQIENLNEAPVEIRKDAWMSLNPAFLILLRVPQWLLTRTIILSHMKSNTASLCARRMGVGEESATTRMPLSLGNTYCGYPPAIDKSYSSPFSYFDSQSIGRIDPYTNLPLVDPYVL